jgi:hypothetical protein
MLLILVALCHADTGPLAGTPSRPGPHVEKIKALGDNEWLNLGSPAADPKWGKARGRSWSTNQPAAPNLRGGFVFGEGVHAYTKPDGHYMNDLWFYDINAHRWVCLYPGIEVKSIVRRIKGGDLTVNDRGLLVDRDGQPLPPLLIHAYGNLAYDPDRKKFAALGGQFANYFTTDGERGVFREANKLFQEASKGKKVPGHSPFYYDVATGKWECHPVEGAVGSSYGERMLVYIRSKKQFLYLGAKEPRYLDGEKRTWVAVKPTGTLPTGIDHCAAYDPTRDCIYYYTTGTKKAEHNFFVYDVKTNAWSNPKTKGTGPFHATSYESVFSYDTANDALVVLRLYDKPAPGYRRGVYVYDPRTMTWADPLPIPAEVVKSIRNGNHGFYDPELNAYFCHFAGDSTDNGTMWAYRYRKGKP